MDRELQRHRGAGGHSGAAGELPVSGRRRGMQISVGPRESREFILTNKEKAYFAGETGTTNTRSYEGLIVELHKFLEGWECYLGDTPLSAWGVKSACVLPQSMTREYVVEQAAETVFLADTLNLLIVTCSTSYRGRAAFVPRVDIRSIWEERMPDYETRWDEEHCLLAVRRADHAERTPAEDYPVWLVIACDRPARFVPDTSYERTTYTKDAARRAMGSASPYVPGRIEIEFADDDPFSSATTFAVAVGDTIEEATSVALRGIESEFALYDAKMRRISDVIAGFGAAMRDCDYRCALSWAVASLDALIMNTLGRGIFAGLHWFPNYWGRDTFISLPGACLVRGEFETARSIIETFAELQNRSDGDPARGRIPNLAMPGETYYNTADGTWWFVREIYEYLRYTGDLPFARRMLPSVELAIEGALEQRADDHSLVRHGQAETWMDAGGEANPLSPRGDRAVEVQALWYTALRSGAAMARAAGRAKLADRWDERAERVRSSFRDLFWDEGRGALYDHLDADGAPDRRDRPNQVFAVTVPWDRLLSDAEEGSVVRDVMETCVLPHGVASLSPRDPGFHPRHLDLEQYHFDEAYHNGDVWVWLTGPLVSALVKRGMVGAAWEQTVVLRDLMFEEGAAGTLPELRNGVPPEGGENVAGAVSQAWSLAEFLRNFYQDYLGIRPDLLSGTLEVAPSLPPGLTWAASPIRLGDGRLFCFFQADDDGERATCRLSADGAGPALDVTFVANAPPAAPVQERVGSAAARLEPGQTLVFSLEKRGSGWLVSALTIENCVSSEGGAA